MEAKVGIFENTFLTAKGAKDLAKGAKKDLLNKSISPKPASMVSVKIN